MDELRRDLHRLGTFCGIEPAVTAAKAKDLGDAVAVVQFEKERADDVVEPGAQAATRHNARPRLFRVEEKFRTRAGQLELKSWLGTDFDPLGDADVVADRVATCGGEAWLAERRGVHREKGGGLRFVEFEELVHSSSGGRRGGFQLRRGCVVGGFVGPAFRRAAGLLQARWRLVRSNEVGFVAFIVGNPHNEPNTGSQSIRPTSTLYDPRMRIRLAAGSRHLSRPAQHCRFAPSLLAIKQRYHSTGLLSLFPRAIAKKRSRPCRLCSRCLFVAFSLRRWRAS